MARLGRGLAGKMPQVGKVPTASKGGKSSGESKNESKAGKKETRDGKRK